MASEDVSTAYCSQPSDPSRTLCPAAIPPRFKPTKPEESITSLREYCGTKPFRMIGWVYVMEPKVTELAQRRSLRKARSRENGMKLFEQIACRNCHKAGQLPAGPNWWVFGKQGKLAEAEP